MDDDPIALLSRLVAIDSVNPDLLQGGHGEAEIAAFVSEWLTARGFEVQRLEARPGRPSIVGRMRGSDGGPSLMFNGHLDTVGHAAYEGDALSGAIIEDKLHGRGSNDMKGGVAAMLVAAARAGRRGLKGDVIVACVSDEEYAGRGTEEVVAHVTADAAIVTEPTQLALFTCHKGFAWFDLVFRGRAAHGSRPDLGVDAITMAGRFLGALEAYGLRLAANPTHPIMKSGSVHASIISGGQEIAAYPAECQLAVERRTVPGETPQSVLAELQEILDGLSRDDPTFDAQVTLRYARPPFSVDPDSHIVRLVSEVGTEIMGTAPPLGFLAGWADSCTLQEAGIPCVLFGAVGAGSHASQEWASIPSVVTLTEVLTETAIRFCQPNGPKG